MRRAALLGLAALAGCGGGGDDAQRPLPKPHPSDSRLIRSWSIALNAGNYEQAATYFATGAIIEQDEEFKLPSRLAAIQFNRGLPCKADVTRVEDEGKTSLATFRLKRGPGGPCSGRARVRFTILRGKFTEWRQLPGRDSSPAPGDSA